jgi:ABC-type sugar transport system permease subunit
MSPGLALMILLVIYPIIFTVYTAFTNYSDGHLYSKARAIAIHENKFFTAQDAPRYSWTAFVSEVDPTKYALWLTRTTDAGLEVFFAQPDERSRRSPPTAPTPRTPTRASGVWSDARSSRRWPRCKPWNLA